MLRQIPQSLKLPWFFTSKNGAVVELGVLQDCDLEDALALVKSCSRLDLGFDPQQLTCPTQLINKLTFKNTSLFGLWHVQRKRVLLGIKTFNDSPICRSLKPQLLGGYYINQARHLQVDSINGQPHLNELSRQLKYTGMATRTPITNVAAIKRLLKNNGQFCGCIPRSLYDRAYGEITDMIVCQMFSDPVLSLHTTLPALEHNPWTTVNPSAVSMLMVATDLGGASSLLQEAAVRGQGFGVDEFTEEGSFSGGLLADKEYFIAKDLTSSDVIGAAVLGRSALSRDPNSKTASTYFYVRDTYWGKGIGQWMLGWLEERACRNGYVAMTTDVYDVNSRGLNLMVNGGYSMYGTLPLCGQIQGQGWRGSVIVHKLLTGTNSI